MTREEILITDIPSRMVSGKIGRKGKPGQWRCCPYRCREYSGVMVTCGMSTNPEPLVIRLGAKGLYRIHLGIFNVFEGFETWIRVRLSSDTCCRALKVPVREHGSDVYVYEMPWRDADLTNQDLILEGEFGKVGSLASVRLEPIASLPKAGKPKIAFPMAITEDGHQAFVKRPHRRPEDLLEALDEIPAESCMKILIWGTTGADLCNYPTREGTYDYGRSEDPLCSWYQVRDENMRLWKKKGWNSMEVMRDYARKRGWEFHVSMRAQAFSAHYPFDEALISDFFNRHPEWRCVDEKGETIARMSYAYPQVQDHLLAIMQEMLAYEPDGLCIIFVRGIPLVLYEPVMREGFKRECGLDPLKLPENDARWTAYKCSVITAYMRRVKALLKRGQRLAVMVPASKSRRMWGGLDIERWVREGIIDDLYPMALRYDELDCHRCGAARSLRMESFQRLRGRENIRVIPILNEGPDPKLRGLMRSHLMKGADGYALWDGAHPRLEYFHNLGYPRLRHPAVRKPEYRRIQIERIGDMRIDRYHPWEVF